MYLAKLQRKQNENYDTQHRGSRENDSRNEKARKSWLAAFFAVAKVLNIIKWSQDSTESTRLNFDAAHASQAFTP